MLDDGGFRLLQEVLDFLRNDINASEKGKKNGDTSEVLEDGFHEFQVVFGATFHQVTGEVVVSAQLANTSILETDFKMVTFGGVEALVIHFGSQ